jgi:hypothetical protein
MSLSNSPFNGISLVIKPPGVLITSRSALPGPRSIHFASAPAAMTAVLNCSMLDMLPPEHRASAASRLRHVQAEHAVLVILASPAVGEEDEVVGAVP